MKTKKRKHLAKKKFYFTIPNYNKEEHHHWADYIELMCLLNKDGITSQTDFLDRTSPQKDVEDSEDYRGSKKNIDLNETTSQDAEDYFRVLEYRVSAFHKYYPFRLSDNGKSIYLISSLTDDHKLYLSLLFSSLLGPFKEFKPELTSSFELISQHALKRLLPVNSKSFIFGSSNIDNASTEKEAHSLLWEKLHQLASNIKESVVIKKENLSQYNRGDGGLDIYAWVDLGDSNQHFPLFFCQCACTPEWVKKQNSSKFDRWSNFISFSTYPLNIVFIPFSFRSATGEWHKSYHIEKSILVDRQRLLYCFQEDENKFLMMESFKAVDHILKIKEPIF